ncbi:hypothetical protein M0P65_04415 [Candidatus Gracilibacteria bacterium]|nr:hypothetical protein [Candidatus Gracilibacteria bacterium]
MFDKIRNLDFKTIAKFIGIAVLVVVFLLIVLGILSSLMSVISSNFLGGSSNLNRQTTSIYPPSSGMNFGASKSMEGAVSDSINYTESNVPENVPNGNYDVKSYSVSIDSSNVEVDCNYLLAGLNKDYIKKDQVNQAKHYCSFNIKVLKGKEGEFIAFLQTFKVKDLSTNISNIVKSYINLSDKIEEAKKRLTEVEDLLQNSKTSYDELWNSLKIKNVSAESIDALNKIILNKSELISKFSKERSTLIDMINSYTKQKQDYDEQIKYIDFYISVSERKLFDWENIKDGWYSDYKELILVFNDTVKNLSVNLISFLFKTINVVIYAVLSIFFILIGGKGLYKMGRRIIFGKERKR